MLLCRFSDVPLWYGSHVLVVHAHSVAQHSLSAQLPHSSSGEYTEWHRASCDGVRGTLLFCMPTYLRVLSGRLDDSCMQCGKAGKCGSEQQRQCANSLHLSQ